MKCQGRGEGGRHVLQCEVSSQKVSDSKLRGWSLCQSGFNAFQRCRHVRGQEASLLLLMCKCILLQYSTRFTNSWNMIRTLVGLDWKRIVFFSPPYFQETTWQTWFQMNFHDKISCSQFALCWGKFTGPQTFLNPPAPPPKNPFVLVYRGYHVSQNFMSYGIILSCGLHIF